MRQMLSLFSDILAALEAIDDDTSAIDFEAFAHDRRRRSSVYWNLTVLGESANQLLKIQPDLQTQFPELERSISVRHRIVHGYFKIDDRTVWAIVTERLPGLYERIRAHIESATSGEDKAGPRDV